jgi:hypothetical protein
MAPGCPVCILDEYQASGIQHKRYYDPSSYTVWNGGVIGNMFGLLGAELSHGRRHIHFIKSAL